MYTSLRDDPDGFIFSGSAAVELDGLAKVDEVVSDAADPGASSSTAERAALGVIVAVCVEAARVHVTGIHDDVTHAAVSVRYGRIVRLGLSSRESG